MRVVLIYPPPWKIPDPDHLPDSVDGPPSDYRQGDLDADFFQVPYGLLSLAANCASAGYPVKVLNLSSFTWSSVEAIVSQLSADVVGLSCWTANRRGVRLVAKSIKSRNASTYIVVGGPHATPLARPILEKWPEIDCVVVGEGEATFLEILSRLKRESTLTDIAGAVTRVAGRIYVGPRRTAIAKLDDLASVHDYFPTHIVMTSRGCPWNCTFCGSETSWGRGFRSLSVSRVLDTFEHALQRVKVRILLLKDDTFTANRKRVLEICKGIRDRNLKFLWSCDTRVDVLDDELLREMRLAGCERLSLGVESGSPAVLRAINKRITVEQIVKSAAAARRFGIRTRFYMMLGNRGETEATFRESLAFLQHARPSSYIFSCLSIYPGTDDYNDAVSSRHIDPECYFTGNFQELKTPFDAPSRDAQIMNEWFFQHRGVQVLHIPNVSELREVLAALGEHHAAHLDLAEALIEEGDFPAAEYHLERADALNSPVPGLVLNARACMAAKRSDFSLMKELLVLAAKIDPQHILLLRNAAAAKAWLESGGLTSGRQLHLDCRHDFQLFERTQQPVLPGPLPENSWDWAAPSSVCPIVSEPAKTPPSKDRALVVLPN